ncbi:hypothetical protein [Megasphaera elsdenii]|uniref:Uncharacterized protein n=1 Tax=Megasphaera elsdenii TaxID=907 RepID=A0A848ESW4_MEGEL|nr:hypothetical protein [Megasphaera elsdenii]NMK40091.1 hypothetical protein [Megasphaera elsdenii]
MMKKKEIVVTIFMVLLFLVPIYVATLPFTWIFQIELIDKIQSLLPKSCFYIEDILGASLKDGETGQIIDDNLKASLTKNNVIYAVGHYGFYIIDGKNEILKIFPSNNKIINNYKEKHHIKTGKDNVLILTEADLTIEESEIRKKLISAAYSKESPQNSDIDVYMWRR